MKKDEMTMKKLEDYVVSIPDFPEEGIIFREVRTILTSCYSNSYILNLFSVYFISNSFFIYYKIIKSVNNYITNYTSCQ